jgi:hypothetical protein
MISTNLPSSNRGDSDDHTRYEYALAICYIIVSQIIETTDEELFFHLANHIAMINKISKDDYLSPFDDYKILSGIEQIQVQLYDKGIEKIQELQGAKSHENS